MEKSKLILCDTDVIIEFYKHNDKVIETFHEIGKKNIVVSVITIGELIHGAINKDDLKKITDSLSLLNTVQINSEICNQFLKLMTKYSLSHKPGIADCFIAATAMEQKLELYTLNKKDFMYIDGLKIFK